MTKENGVAYLRCSRPKYLNTSKSPENSEPQFNFIHWKKHENTELGVLPRDFFRGLASEKPKRLVSHQCEDTWWVLNPSQCLLIQPAMSTFNTSTPRDPLWTVMWQMPSHLEGTDQVGNKGDKEQCDSRSHTSQPLHNHTETHRAPSPSVFY